MSELQIRSLSQFNSSDNRSRTLLAKPPTSPVAQNFEFIYSPQTKSRLNPIQ